MAAYKDVVVEFKVKEFNRDLNGKIYADSAFDKMIEDLGEDYSLPLNLMYPDLGQGMRVKVGTITNVRRQDKELCYTGSIDMAGSFELAHIDSDNGDKPVVKDIKLKGFSVCAFPGFSEYATSSEELEAAECTSFDHFKREDGTCIGAHDADAKLFPGCRNCVKRASVISKNSEVNITMTVAEFNSFVDILRVVDSGLDEVTPVTSLLEQLHLSSEEKQKFHEIFKRISTPTIGEIS